MLPRKKKPQKQNKNKTLTKQWKYPSKPKNKNQKKPKTIIERNIETTYLFLDCGSLYLPHYNKH